MRKDKIISFIFRLISYITFFTIVFIFIFIILDGIKYFSIDFFTQFPKNMMTEGGIFPAIIGTFYLLFLTLIISIPFGVITGIFLSEYGNNKIGSLLDITITSLSGVPSIVYGLFGLALFSITMGFRTSLISGALTLSVMSLPIISSATREALMAIPNSMRESAYALGANKTEVIYKVIIPSAKSRILTAILIGAGRVMGETAPVLLTSAVFYSTHMPKSIKDPIMTLPTHIYNIAMAYGNDAQWMAKGTASFLMLLVFVIYSIAFRLRRKLNEK
ncbi:phosphate ABC transporter membrane protein 2, PhoT family [Marinitoga hydrogenitolerans DSM 16785]|uniref:Phosphate transport system permease protein PstA n=1 Tax=Marinitoga hydrogenitolerans (strain DSM 16785 / JCM 12826 / AT1271) TaxID=1122195 RepID=A0A1M4SG24_MARH1|nr:phosphate ABC transporter permease PstA [Marinitoga hydrogenitolerans]SHE30947.1 phosphate ABC transporter membrane protein 2, PhoT family [Marinitoga hydrogenitolerans DSM 16785]